jgi:hypothetical protein
VLSTLKELSRLCVEFGVDPVRTWRATRTLPVLLLTALRYSRLYQGGPFDVKLLSLRLCTRDFDGVAGSACGHYFFQDLWAARRIFSRRPEMHVDVASRIDGFVAHVLSFMPVTVVDVRPLASVVRGLTFIQSDATSLGAFGDRTLDSVSSLHAVEHFGLGRYGDAINPNAPFVAMRALARVLRPEGRLYFAVPIGIERLEFNAHRIFSPETVIEVFESHNLCLTSFHVVDDKGCYHEDVQPKDFRSAKYACGMFEFTR